jgi:uncharacterized protein YndB with AHSA1/START domain
MELGSIVREIYVEAAPEIVFDVVSSPEHVKEWWADEARYEASPGSAGDIVFGEGTDAKVVPFTVLEVAPPVSFSFRWAHPAGESAGEGNSLLVTFHLTPRDGGTLVRMTETGFRELGWEAAVLEQEYRDHNIGWDYYLPRLAAHAEELEVRR